MNYLMSLHIGPLARTASSDERSPCSRSKPAGWGGLFGAPIKVNILEFV